MEKTNRRFKLTFLLLVSAVISLHANAYHEKSEPSDGTVGSFIAVKNKMNVSAASFFDKNQQLLNLKKFEGKIILLNIWATWCGPCIRELPALDRLQAKLNHNDFVILTVSIDKKNAATTLDFYQKLGLKNIEFYHDSKKQMKKYFPLDVVPANFIIDRKGTAISFLRSFVNWDDPLAVVMFENYIKQKSDTLQLWKPTHPSEHTSNHAK